MADQFTKDFKVKKRILDFAETWHTSSLDEKKIGKKNFCRENFLMGLKIDFEFFELGQI